MISKDEAFEVSKDYKDVVRNQFSKIIYSDRGAKYGGIV